MYLLQIIFKCILFGCFFAGIFQIGKTTNKKFNNSYKDKAHLNLIYGLSILSFLVGLLLVFNILNLYLIITFILIFFFYFLFEFIKNFKFNLNFKNLFFFFFFLGIFLLGLEKYSTISDDEGGYFYLIENIINGNLGNPDILHRVYALYPYFSILNSIFIIFTDYSSAYFFDFFFGSSIIFFTLIRNFKNKNNFLFFLTLSIVFLACVSFQDTNTPKLLITSIIFLLIFEVENYYKTNKGLTTLILISILLIILKFINLIAYTNFLILFIILEKIFKKNCSVFNLSRSLVIGIIFISPWIIYSINLFGTPLTQVLNGENYYLLNENFLKLNIEIVRTMSFYDWINGPIAAPRQIIIFVIFSSIFLIIFQKREKFIFFLIISFLINLIILNFEMYPDHSNYLRYMQPYFVSIVSFMFIKILDHKSFTKVNLKNSLFILILIVLCLRINLNISFFIKDGLTNLKNLSENKILKYEKKYKKNFLNLTKNHEEKILALVSKPYLLDISNNPNFTYIERNYGYILSNNDYPLNKEYIFKKNFLLNENIEMFIIEKNFLDEKLGIIKRHMIKEKKIKSKNIILDDYNVHLTSHHHKFFYDDLFMLLKDEVDKKLIDSNEIFEIYQIIY